MTRHVITLANERMRDRAVQIITEKDGQGNYRLPSMARVEFLGPKRSSSQNSAMWAMLSDLAEQLVWNGQKMTAEDYKLVMLDALRRERHHEMRIVPNSDKTGWLDISSTRSSELSHEEMGMLLTIISAFGDQHGIAWSEPKAKDTRPTPPISAYEDAPQIATANAGAASRDPEALTPPEDKTAASGDASSEWAPLELDDMDEFAETGAPF